MKAHKVSLQNPAYEAANSEDKSILDYAHGHITDTTGKRVDGQQTVACIYEYARECRVFCNLATAFRKRDCQSDFGADREIIGDSLGRMDETVFYWQWLWVDGGPYFPQSPWRDIPLTSRPRYQNRTIPLPALRMIECADYGLKAKEANDAALAEYQRRIREVKTPTNEANVNAKYGTVPTAIWRIKEANEIVAFFRLDTRLSKDLLQDCFKAWLDLPENSAFFEEARTAENRTVGSAADRLKDLAIWRLHRRFAGECSKVREFLLGHRKRQNGKRLVFLNDKPGRGKGGALAVNAMEKRGESYFLDAVRRAEAHYKKLFFFTGHNDRMNEAEEDLSKRIDHHLGVFFNERK